MWLLKSQGSQRPSNYSERKWPLKSSLNGESSLHLLRSGHWNPKTRGIFAFSRMGATVLSDPENCLRLSWFLPCRTWNVLEPLCTILPSCHCWIGDLWQYFCCPFVIGSWVCRGWWWLSWSFDTRVPSPWKAALEPHERGKCIINNPEPWTECSATIHDFCF